MTCRRHKGLCTASAQSLVALVALAQLYKRILLQRTCLQNLEPI